LGFGALLLLVPVAFFLVMTKLHRGSYAPATAPAATPAYSAAAGATYQEQLRSDPCDAGPCRREFYMYRAQSDVNYPMQNVNTASLAGVMWYLHNEIVQSVPRKYDVTRVMRLKVTMMNTQEWWTTHQSQFGAYVAFDMGHCTVPNCQHIWDTYGYIVGCQAPNTGVANYRADRRTMKECNVGRCHAPIWYSLPGACPQMRYDMKTPFCKQNYPGGFAFASYNETTGLGRRDDWEVTGGRTATYHVDWAGEVTLDELVGIYNYSDFMSQGYREYDKMSDQGYGTTFWNGIHNESACRWRMNRLRDLLNQKIDTKYGTTSRFPRDLPEPMCDSGAPS